MYIYSTVFIGIKRIFENQYKVCKELGSLMNDQNSFNLCSGYFFPWLIFYLLIPRSLLLISSRNSLTEKVFMLNIGFCKIGCDSSKMCFVFYLLYLTESKNKIFTQYSLSYFDYLMIWFIAGFYDVLSSDFFTSHISYLEFKICFFITE